MVNATLYFNADDGVHGYELWRSDGTEAGTTLVKDLNPGAADNYLRVLNDANGILYLSANGGPNGIELWRSDGTEAGTTLVKQIMGGIFPPIVVKGRVLYFGAGSGLWRSDGTPQGTTLVRGGRSGRSFSVESLTLANGTLYFVGTDKRHGRKLWQSDGTRAGTKIVRNIRRGSASSWPNRLTAVGGSLFFTAKDRSHGRELWRAGPKPCKTAKGKCKKG